MAGVPCEVHHVCDHVGPYALAMRKFKYSIWACELASNWRRSVLVAEEVVVVVLCC